MATKQNIAVPLIPDPRGVQIPIQAMQNALITLPWLEFAYGEAREAVINEEGSRYITPQVYAQQREWVDLQPDDVTSAFSFFEVTEAKTNIDKSSSYWRQPISLVVYCNLELIDSSLDWIFTEKLIEETTSLLTPYNLPFINLDSMSVERHIENAFSKYDYWTSRERFIKRNYDAFKIDFLIQYDDKCPLN